MTTTSYKVTGMSCEHCANAVTSELGGLDGVSAVTVDLVPDGVSLVTVTSARHCRPRSARPSTRPATTGSAGSLTFRPPAEPGGPVQAPGTRLLDEHRNWSALICTRCPKSSVMTIRRSGGASWSTNSSGHPQLH